MTTSRDGRVQPHEEQRAEIGGDRLELPGLLIGQVRDGHAGPDERVIRVTWQEFTSTHSPQGSEESSRSWDIVDEQGEGMLGEERLRI